MGEFVKLANDFGIQAVVTLAVLTGGWRLIMMMVKMMESQNLRWQKIVEDLQITLTQHREDVKEAHQYQRNEHEKLAILQTTQINRSEKQLETLEQISLAVGRINGYSDDVHLHKREK